MLHLPQWESTVFPWLLLLIIAVLLQPAHRDLQSDLRKITLTSQVAETSNFLDWITQDDASSMRQWKFVGESSRFMPMLSRSNGSCRWSKNHWREELMNSDLSWFGIPLTGVCTWVMTTHRMIHLDDDWCEAQHSQPASHPSSNWHWSATCPSWKRAVAGLVHPLSSGVWRGCIPSAVD